MGKIFLWLHSSADHVWAGCRKEKGLKEFIQVYIQYSYGVTIAYKCRDTIQLELGIHRGSDPVPDSKIYK